MQSRSVETTAQSNKQREPEITRTEHVWTIDLYTCMHKYRMDKKKKTQGSDYWKEKEKEEGGGKGWDGNLNNSECLDDAQHHAGIKGGRGDERGASWCGPGVM